MLLFLVPFVIMWLISAVPTYLPFVIVVSAFLSFVLLGTMISICCCQCVKPKPADRPSPTQTSLVESGGPSPKSSTPSCTANTGLHPTRPGPSDLSVYSGFPPAFVSPLHQGAPQFYSNYPNYPLPPEHTMLIAPAFLDVHAHGHNPPFPQDPIYPTVTVWWCHSTSANMKRLTELSCMVMEIKITAITLRLPSHLRVAKQFPESSGFLDSKYIIFIS